MKFVYLIMSGKDGGRLLGVRSNERTATNIVRNNARVVHNIDPDREPLDFSGALTRYGWADRIWWQKEVLYD